MLVNHIVVVTTAGKRDEVFDETYECLSENFVPLHHSSLHQPVHFCLAGVSHLSNIIHKNGEMSIIPHPKREKTHKLGYT